MPIVAIAYAIHNWALVTLFGATYAIPDLIDYSGRLDLSTTSFFFLQFAYIPLLGSFAAVVYEKIFVAIMGQAMTIALIANLAIIRYGKIDHESEDISRDPITAFFQIRKIKKDYKKAEIKFKRDYARAMADGTQPPAPPYYKLEDHFKIIKRIYWIARIAVVLMAGFGVMGYLTDTGRKQLMSEVADTVHDKTCENTDGIIRRWALGLSLIHI